MAVDARSAMNVTRSTGLAAVCAAMMACSGGHHKSDVHGEQEATQIDKQGAGAVLYESDQTGTTASHDTDDPTAKQRATVRTEGNAAGAVQARQRERLNLVRKRQPKDPIYVELAPLVLDDNMQRAERSKGVVAEQLRREFARDPVIKLTDEVKNRSGLLKPRMRVDAPIEIVPKASLKEAYGIDRKTGKRSKTLAVIFEATIISQVPPATYTVSESGHVMKNVEVSKRFAQRVKHVILEKIGPEIPAP